MRITLGSLFDGLGVFPLAASSYGIEPLWASEIEKVPISITKKHFPQMQHLGDITKLDGAKIPPVHIIPLVRSVKIYQPSERVRDWLVQNPVYFIMQSVSYRK